MGLNEGQDPLASVARGATHGLLDWTKEQLAELVARIRDREIAFVQDPDTVDLVREERKSEEWAILKGHIHDPKLRILVQMGFVLRRMERDPSRRERLHDLRTKILRKFGAAGLRAAELVQREVFGSVFLKLVREAKSPVDLETSLEDLLNRVDAYTVFIQEKDGVKEVVKELNIRILARTAQVFIVFGYGQAKTKAKKVVDEVLKTLPRSYGAEKHETEKDFYAFVGKVEKGELQLVLPF